MVHVDEHELWTKQKKLEVKTKSYWAKLRVKNQNKNQYYDVLVGEKNKDPHIHLGIDLLGNLIFNKTRNLVISMERKVKSEMHGKRPQEKIVLAERDRRVKVKLTATVVGDTKESAISIFGLKEI